MFKFANFAPIKTFEPNAFPSSASQSLHTRQLLTAAVIPEIVRELAHGLIVVV